MEQCHLGSHARASAVWGTQVGKRAIPLAMATCNHPRLAAAHTAGGSDDAQLHRRNVTLALGGRGCTAAPGCGTGRARAAGARHPGCWDHLDHRRRLVGVDVDLAHVVDDDGNLHARLVGENMLQQRCLARAQETAQDGRAQFLFGMLPLCGSSARHGGCLFGWLWASRWDAWPCCTVSAVCGLAAVVSILTRRLACDQSKRSG